MTADHRHVHDDITRIHQAVLYAECGDLGLFRTLLAEGGICGVAAEYLFSVHVRKLEPTKWKRGPRPHAYVPLWVKRARAVKAELKAAGVYRGRQEKAIEIVGREHEAFRAKLREIHGDEAPRLPAFDPLAVENALRRSRKFAAK
jgi:hypothetical protein